jgi:hypothetical protein
LQKPHTHITPALKDGTAKEVTALLIPAQLVKWQDLLTINLATIATSESIALVSSPDSMDQTKKHAQKASTLTQLAKQSAHSVLEVHIAHQESSTHALLQVITVLQVYLLRPNVLQVSTAMIHRPETHPYLVVGVNTPLQVLINARLILITLLVLSQTLPGSITPLPVLVDGKSWLENIDATNVNKVNNAVEEIVLHVERTNGP